MAAMGYHAGLGLALSLAAIPVALLAQDDSIDASQGGPNVLVIVPHPDDEIVIAHAISRLARTGGTVKLVFATSGDAGPGVSGMERGADLADLREREARCAAFSLGLEDPEFWQIGDGTLGVEARMPDSAANRALTRIETLIDTESPNVIMTWGPDGGYGHSDHRMLSALITEAVQKRETGRPDLIYAAIPTIQGPIPPQFEAWATTASDLITDRIAYEEQDLEAARGALDCYESQFDDATRGSLIDFLHAVVWKGQIHFRMALPSVG
ncbi:MAG: PIG-L family deacetylase [Pseudomonadota bacterium]